MGAEAGSEDQAFPKALGRLRVALDDAYLRASRVLALTPQQAELLCAAMSPASVGELAVALRCDRSNVSRLVDRASTRGLIKRHGGEDDGRVTVVELTPEGERLARRFLTALQSHTEALRAEWPQQRQQLTVELLNGISNGLDAARYQPERRRRRQIRTKDAHAIIAKATPRLRRDDAARQGRKI
jgi:DNA-binding MarR family transcriptional regulator